MAWNRTILQTGTNLQSVINTTHSLKYLVYVHHEEHLQCYFTNR